VTALFVKAFPRDVWSADALITGGKLGFFGELFQFFGDHCAAREKHWQARADIIVENEQFQFFAEFTVIALLRFLEHRKIIVEFLLRFECGAVNALQLRVLFVAFVVSARHVRELERADVSGPHHVRAGAEIDEIATAIERNFFVGRDVFDDVELEFAWLITIAQRGEPAFLAKRERFVTRNFDPFERVIRFDFVFHLGLDLFEIIR
jgi:hypothetical protein